MKVARLTSQWDSIPLPRQWWTGPPGHREKSWWAGPPGPVTFRPPGPFLHYNKLTDLRKAYSWKYAYTLVTSMQLIALCLQCCIDQWHP